MGGGITSLAAAAFFIWDGQLSEPSICILETTELVDGSLDSARLVDRGYAMRGGRMLNFTYRCTYDLAGSMPSLEHPDCRLAR